MTATARRPRRDCACRTVKHEHGTREAYLADLCGCAPCRAAHAAGARAHRRSVAYGRRQSRVVPATGSLRRLQALACCGWSLATIARRMGATPATLDRLVDRPTITRGKAEKIRAIYDELWDCPPPQTTTGERIVVARTLGLARRRGYASPLEWDDDTTDDPDARPVKGSSSCARAVVDPVAVDEALSGRPVHLTKAERAAVVEVGTRRGLTAREIAERSGIATRTVVRWRREAVA